MGRVGFVYIGVLTLGERPLDRVVCAITDFLKPQKARHYQP